MKDAAQAWDMFVAVVIPPPWWCMVVHLFAMYSLFALLSNYCSVAVFAGFCWCQPPRISSLFIIRHFIMRECIGTVLLVDKQLKSDAERPFAININELHRIHHNSIDLVPISVFSFHFWQYFRSYWKCTYYYDMFAWHCLRINDSNVCCHYRSSSVWGSKFE